MPSRDDFSWFKNTFADDINAAVAGTPFTVDMLAAVAAQETGHIWANLRNKVSLDELLALCVGDTLDADRGRSAFPKTREDLLSASRGDEMFTIAHEALVGMASRVPGFSGVARNPRKFCHAYGIFQYDLQFFKTDPDYFLEQRWRTFDAALGKCLEELRAAARRIGMANRLTLTDLERTHIAIAYNSGAFRPERGLKQGHKDDTGRFYGELFFDFLRLSQTAPTTSSAPIVATPAPGSAPIAAPSPVTSTGRTLEVSVTDSPLRLRSEPKVDRNNPSANVIARLPDGHLVRLVSGTPGDKFFEVETSFNGARFQGFAASEFLVAVRGGAMRGAASRSARGGLRGKAARGTRGRATRGATARATRGAGDIPVVTPAAAPPTSGVMMVLAPRRPGAITKRVAPAGAQSLNEPGQPGRTGTTPEELRTELAAIVDYLAVDKASHVRYQPKAGTTFCNIYAHDYCALAGAYLPRVWWTPDAIERLAMGQTVLPLLGGTIDEQRANDLFRWLRAFGARFGWRQTSTLTKLQTEVNVGAVGLIVARRTLDGKSGHIVPVVPETDDSRARRDATGEVIAPLQSQAGARNFRYGTGTLNWWNGEQFADSAFWIHA